MSREVYIGDVVRTKEGVGIVRDIRTWRDCIEEMEDWQATNFSLECHARVGPEYREDWIELLVVVDRKSVRCQWTDVEVLEGRDDTSKPFRISKGRAKI